MKSVFLTLAVLCICGRLGDCARVQATTPASFPPDDRPDSVMIEAGTEGSTYVPVDSWIYPATDRLHALGYAWPEACPESCPVADWVCCVESGSQNVITFAAQVTWYPRESK
jgi:hypothetical protein